MLWTDIVWSLQGSVGLKSVLPVSDCRLGAAWHHSNAAFSRPKCEAAVREKQRADTVGFSTETPRHHREERTT